MAGLTILLSLIVMLFIIGLIVMIFSLMSSELQDTQYDDASGFSQNETITTVTVDGDNVATAIYGLMDVACTIDYCTNQTATTVIPSTNYTFTSCNLKFAGANSVWNNTNWNCSYTYTYHTTNTATDTINETSWALKGVTDWFDIFVVIGAMVVLILLTVVIITAIRSSGMVSEGSTFSGGAGTMGGARMVGTA